MKNAEFLLIVKDKKMTQIMQACDVWDSGRVVGLAETINVEFKEDVDLTLERAFKMFSSDNVLGDEKNEVVYAELIKIQNDNVITLNDSVVPYIAEGINAISDGDKFFFFREFLEKKGFDVETGNLQCVVSVKFKQKEKV